MKNIAQGILQLRKSAKTVLHKRRVIEQIVDATPKTGRVFDQAEIRLFDERIESAVARLEQIQHLDPGLVVHHFQAVSKAARGRIVAFSKASRENQHLFHGPNFLR